ncbi:carbon-nitrogen hydrolase family protein [Agrococcus jejuensis]|uniref:Predicted amidohydrolase n=1 Tax=Agrococcus jejuensis TaxID=399736 RepID=A0A1G8EEY0_9MICO|nr:carbon-nitrogen hydrolase family protein [Agrococcus jejuensis]SDH68436.1 Predicted amidohydrolase [Agrococcus jejuensis]
MSTLRVGIVQFAPTADPAENVATLEPLVRRAAEQGATLVVCPESSIAFDADDLDLAERVAQPLDGPFVAPLLALATDLGIDLVVGTYELRADGLPYNSSALLRRDGTVAAYRKVHLYDAFGYRESDHIEPGPIEAPWTLADGDLTAGTFTCYDLRFPESARAAVDAGADVLVVPACWAPGVRKLDHWTTLVRARAIESTSWVVAADQAVPNGIGHSMVVDPDGVVRGSLGEGVGVLVVDVDSEAIAATRARVPSLAGRRLGVPMPTA